MSAGKCRAEPSFVRWLWPEGSRCLCVCADASQLAAGRMWRRLSRTRTRNSHSPVTIAQLTCEFDLLRLDLRRLAWIAFELWALDKQRDLLLPLVVLCVELGARGSRWVFSIWRWLRARRVTLAWARAHESYAEKWRESCDCRGFQANGSLARDTSTHTQSGADTNTCSGMN